MMIRSILSLCRSLPYSPMKDSSLWSGSCTTGRKSKPRRGKTPSGGEDTLNEHLIRAEAQVKAMEEASEEEMTPRIKKAKERAARERKERLSHALDELEKIKAKKRAPYAGEHHRPRMQDHEPVGGRLVPAIMSSYLPTPTRRLSSGCPSPSPADHILLPPALDEMERTAGLPDQIVVDTGFTTEGQSSPLTRKASISSAPSPMRQH